jgi:hypothetical protein
MLPKHPACGQPTERRSDPRTRKPVRAIDVFVDELELAGPAARQRPPTFCGAIPVRVTRPGNLNVAPVAAPNSGMALPRPTGRGCVRHARYGVPLRAAGKRANGLSEWRPAARIVPSAASRSGNGVAPSRRSSGDRFDLCHRGHSLAGRGRGGARCRPRWWQGGVVWRRSGAEDRCPSSTVRRRVMPPRRPAPRYPSGRGKAAPFLGLVPRKAAAVVPYPSLALVPQSRPHRPVRYVRSCQDSNGFCAPQRKSSCAIS